MEDFYLLIVSTQPTLYSSLTTISELLLHTLQLPVGHPDQPFTIRLLSFDNLLAAPIDCYCPTSTVAVGGEGGEGGGGIESIDANGNTATNSTGGEVPVRNYCCIVFNYINIFMLVIC